MTARSQSNPWVYHLVSLLVAVVMLGVGLGRFGIWQPSELRVADLARDEGASQGGASSGGAAAAAQSTRPPLQVALVRMGFQKFGPTEQGGRLPTALLAVVATLCLALAVSSVSDARAGTLTAVAYATMPLVFMNARQMFGWGAAQSAFTIFLSAGMYVLWGRPPPGSDDGKASGGAGALWLYGRWVLLATCFLAAAAGGWMLGAVPVLAGLGIATTLRGKDETPLRRVAGYAMAAVGVVLLVLAARAAAAPGDAYSALTGSGGEPHPPNLLPTYEALIEQIGHGIFPWTGIVLFGVVRLLMPPPVRGMKVGPSGEPVDEAQAWRESGARVGALLVAVIAYGLQSFHWQQFGASPYIAAAPLAVAAGLALRDAEREATQWRLITAGATLFTVIIVRDYLLFPKSSYAALGLPDGGPAFPTGFTGTAREWFARGLGSYGEAYFVEMFAITLVLGLCPLFLGAGPVAYIPWDRPFRWLAEVEHENREELRTQPPLFDGWSGSRNLSGTGFLAILRPILAGIVVVCLIVLGVGLTAANMPTIPRTACKVIGAAPILILLATYAIIALWNLFAALGQPQGPLSVTRVLGSRVAFVPLGMFLVGLVTTQGFIPALSEHLSPRGVWAVVRRERRGDEPVARYGGNQGDRATRYYANFDVRDINSEPEAVDWLKQVSPRHWMIVGSDVFPSLNRTFRRSYPEGQRQNVPVIDATNSNLYVASSDLGGRHSVNPLDNIVMSVDSHTATNEHWHAHGRNDGGHFVQEPARFDDAIEYVGYNLDSGGQSFVPVGGTFTITYHFRVLREIPGNQQIFVHVDGQCPRINGDHEPAAGRYPVRYWLPGDYIHDEQRITIPGYCRGGTYYVYMGFFQGDDRMRVTGGDHDRENRVVAARIVVR